MLRILKLVAFLIVFIWGATTFAASKLHPIPDPSQIIKDNPVPVIDCDEEVPAIQEDLEDWVDCLAEARDQVENWFRNADKAFSENELETRYQMYLYKRCVLHEGGNDVLRLFFIDNYGASSEPPCEDLKAQFVEENWQKLSFLYQWTDSNFRLAMQEISSRILKLEAVLKDIPENSRVRTKAEQLISVIQSPTSNE